jgi:hypothetical protein
VAPSTILGLAESSPGAPAEAPGPDTIAAAAALLGGVAGTVLASFQTLALRGHVARAWRWLLANAIAWAVAMPVLFGAVHLLERVRDPAVGLPIGFVVLGVCGAVVGAIHGTMLVRFALPPPASAAQSRRAMGPSRTRLAERGDTVRT